MCVYIKHRKIFDNAFANYKTKHQGETYVNGDEIIRVHYYRDVYMIELTFNIFTNYLLYLFAVHVHMYLLTMLNP